MISEESQKSYDRLVDENKRLRLAVEELSILNDIATAITSTQSLEQIVELIVQKCVKHLKVEQGAVMLLDEEDRDNPFHTMVRHHLPFKMKCRPIAMIFHWWTDFAHLRSLTSM